MNLTTLDNVLWAAGFIGHVALLLVLLLRGRWREFPVFTSLIAYHVGVTTLLFFTHRYGSYQAYKNAYWTAAVGDFILQVALIYEIARIVLRPTGSWIADTRKTFLFWGALGVLIAFGAAETVTPATGSLFSKLEIRGVVFTSLLICELFFAMITAANRLGLQWRSHVMALGQGLTVWAMFALASDVAHIAFGWNRNFATLDYARMCFYLGALLFWTVSFWLPEQKRAPLSADMQKYLLAAHTRVQYDLERLTASRK